ncbi:MAG: hypothetical protein ABSC94_13940 [Polyangiaceae bacterium]
MHPRPQALQLAPSLVVSTHCPPQSVRSPHDDEFAADDELAALVLVLVLMADPLVVAEPLDDDSCPAC